MTSEPVSALQDHLPIATSAAAEKPSDGRTLDQSAIDILTDADRVLHSSSKTGRGWREAIIEALAHRYGLLGQPPITLEAMGKFIGVTRERARQIQIVHQSMSRNQQDHWQQLDTAIDVAQSMAPCAEDALAEELIQRRLTAVRYGFDSLRACAVFADRTLALECFEGIVAADPSHVQAILQVTRRLSSRQGMATSQQISDEALDEGLVLAEDDVGAILSACDSAVWLDAGHVTWREPPRNRLVNTLRTMLSVHQPVEVTAAQRAVANFWSYRNAGRKTGEPELIPPGSEALRAFCEWHKDFLATPEGISSTLDLDHAQELGVEAALLVEVIRSAPNGALDRVSLLDAAEAVGMKASTVGVYLTFHPAFVQLARSVWTVRGAQVPADVVGSIQEQARLRSKAEDHTFQIGQQPDGRPSAAFAVTTNFRMTGVLLRRWLPAGVPSTQLAIVDDQGDPCGSATYNDSTGFTHGFGTYLSRFDLRVGEYLLIIADLEQQAAQLVHGDQSLTSQVEAHVSVPE
jgi:hypothetical protein